LRAGRQFGYDFNANKDMKVGHLRHFVKSETEAAGLNNKRAKASNGATNNNNGETPDGSAKKRKKTKWTLITIWIIYAIIIEVNPIYESRNCNL